MNQIDRLVGDVLRETQTSEAVQARQLQQERPAARLKTIDRVITKLYMDKAEGRLEGCPAIRYGVAASN